jgi:signal transduction histidine kinase
MTTKAIEVPNPQWSRWKIPARIAWTLIFIAITGLFLTTAYFVFEANHERFVINKLSISTFMGDLGALSSILISLGLAYLLFCKRPNDKMAFFVSCFLLVNSIILIPFHYLKPIGIEIQDQIYSIVQPIFFAPLLIAFLSIFPNGRFYPSQMRRVVIAAAIYGPIYAVFSASQLENKNSLFFIGPVVVWFILIFLGLFSQIQRFRHQSNLTERQQTKWVLYGFTLAVFLAFILTIITVGLSGRSSASPLPEWAGFVPLGWYLAFSILPISLTFAVMRFRLYEIDFIINKSIVFGVLTTLILALYISVVVILGYILRVEGNLIISLVATGLAAILLQPIREKLQRSVNSLMYGEQEDPVEVLAKLGERFEKTVPLQETLPTLIKTIAKSLKLSYVSIHFSYRDKEAVVAEYGKPVSDIDHFPLIYQGEKIGQLAVGQRSPGVPFSPGEKELLRTIASQASAAVHAVQLSEELMRSRQMLISTREEERRRLRRDIHDGLGAILVGMNLEATVLRKSIHTNPAKAEQLADEFIKDIRTSIEEVRRIVFDLRPPALDQLGLVEAVRALVNQTNMAESHEGIPLQSTLDAPENIPLLPAAVEVAAYRITQEALTNVVNHAQAKHCTVRIKINKDLFLEIIDDGIGISDSPKTPSGLGLVSIEERVDELGGTCRIESALVGGTRIEVVLPL